MKPEISRERVKLSRPVEEAHQANVNDTGIHQTLAGQGSGESNSSTGIRRAGISTDAIKSLGKGGGSHVSMGQNFQVNPANGTLSFSVPIHTSPGRAGFSPSLSLAYDSGHGNGPFGFGWQLSADSITRKYSDCIPRYNELDGFVMSGIDDLVPTTSTPRKLKHDGREYNVYRYRPRIDDNSLRIENWVSSEDNTDSHWRTISGSNVTTIFGLNDDSRIFDAEGGFKKIFSWLACIMCDAKGNSLHFVYKSENSEGLLEPSSAPYEATRTNRSRSRAKYLKHIYYGNRKPNRDLSTWELSTANQEWLFQVVLDYGEHDIDNPTLIEAQTWPVRKDVFSIYKSGFEIRTYRLCRRILMFHHMPEKMDKWEDCLVSSTNFTYEESESATCMTSIQACGYISAEKPSTYIRQVLPPLEFQYTAVPSLEKVPLQTIHVNAIHDLQDIHSRSEWIDLNGEGAPGLLIRLDDGSLVYQRNENLANTPSEDISEGDLGPTQVLSQQPAILSGGKYYFEDLDGNGQLDLVCMSEKGDVWGFYGRLHDEWLEFKTFSSIPSAEVLGEAVRRIDLTGNGRSDLMSVNENTNEIIWHESYAKDGFGEGNRSLRSNNGPQIMSNDQLIATYLADMSGDGLTDVVQISNGRVSYWPNLGHGRFGKEIVMGNSPRMADIVAFTHSHIQLADIDGSGTTDLIYLPEGGGAVVYYNNCGNSWSNACPILSFPELDSSSSVFSIDILGNGTSCLCWSDSGSEIQFLDLMGGQKPHLLKTYSNGLGSSSAIDYKPSTRYYLQDERRGQPWSTKLPFPVHCVSKVTVTDEITASTYVSRYAYHEGYFDGVEREFRGFGLVERWDAEESSIDKPSIVKQPPLLTKTWFHTGSLDALKEPPYASSPSQLPRPRLPKEVTANDFQEVCRSLRGIMRREEIYACDDTDKARLPYSVSEMTHEIHRIQPATDGNPGIFRITQTESIVSHYDRDLSDPRVEHELSLETNEYGDVLKSLSVNYGRQKSLLKEAIDRSKQRETVILFKDTSYTNDIDEDFNYRHPLPSSTREYRLQGLKFDGRLSFDSLTANNFDKLNAIPVVQFNNTGLAENATAKILIGESRKLYRNNGMTDQLPLNVLEAYSVEDQRFTLVATDTLLVAAFGRDKLTEEYIVDDLMGQGGHVHFDNDDNWWAPSSRSRFDLDTEFELAVARSSFYLPLLSIDEFDQVTFQEMDEYYLLVTKTVDPVMNVIDTKYDYSRLAAIEITDPNENRYAMALDSFGNVVGTAWMGKQEEDVGDSLNTFPVVLSDEDIDDFLNDPVGEIATNLLGSAGQRRILGHLRHYHSKCRGDSVPSFEAVITRDKHYFDTSETPNISVKIAYLDGNGDVIQEFSLASLIEYSPKWIVSGWNVRDNKGNIIRSYQPSFCATHEFVPGPNPDSKSFIVFHDPLGRVVGNLNPDKTWTKHQFTPWSNIDFNESDNVLTVDASSDPDVGFFFKSLERSAYFPSWHTACLGQDQWTAESARKAEICHGTPTETHLDTLGNPFLIIERDKKKIHNTRSDYNVLGKISARYDARSRAVEKSDFDLLGRALHSITMDSGSEWTLRDCRGLVMLEWNSRGIFKRKLYDALGRMVQQHISQDSEKPKLVHRLTYGEAPTGSSKNNQFGKLISVEDQSGKLQLVDFDFKGNCVKSCRQFAVEYKTTLDWKESVPLQDDLHWDSSEFDALNREIGSFNGRGEKTTRDYNRLGDLISVSWSSKGDNPESFISSISYSADRLPLKILYGNGARSEFEYDPATRIPKRRSIFADTETLLSDEVFTRDCLQRLTHVVDQVKAPVYLSNCQVEAASDFTYDARNQLVRAAGREQFDTQGEGGQSLRVAVAKASHIDNFLPGDGSDLIQYTETYEYDDTGNITSLKHEPSEDKSVSGWTRGFSYTEPSAIDGKDSCNKLSQTTIGEDEEEYEYDFGAKSGCMTSMAEDSSLNWGFDNTLRSSVSKAFIRQERETTWYVCDYFGGRVRKITEKAHEAGSTAQIAKEQITLPAVELHRVYNADGSIEEERVFSDVIGNASFATVESCSDSTMVRYRLSDRMEVDENGQVIAYEEFSPFGVTTYLASRKDVRTSRRRHFSAYEQDKETGLYHCGARYFAPWIGRWTSSDPLGTMDGLNLYAYCSNDPVNFNDPSGRNKDKVHTSFADKIKTMIAKENHVSKTFARRQVINPNRKGTKLVPLTKQHVQITEETVNHEGLDVKRFGKDERVEKITAALEIYHSSEKREAKKGKVNETELYEMIQQYKKDARNWKEELDERHVVAFERNYRGFISRKVLYRMIPTVSKK